jgi:hypothetical protein
MTTRPSGQTRLQRLLARLAAWLPARPVEVNHDELVGVEHLGHVVLLTYIDGCRRPITFETRQRAEVWFQRTDGIRRARREALRSPPELARLAEGLRTAASGPGATPDHVLGVLVAALSHASVSVATLDLVDGGLMIRCRRFGRLHLAGTMPTRAGRALLDTIADHLDGAPDGDLALSGGFPGPRLRAHVTVGEHGARLLPAPPTGQFSDLASWGVTPRACAVVRELLRQGPGLLLIVGGRDTGKSTLAAICQAESRLMCHGVDIQVIDEIDDLATAQDALGHASHRLVIATLRAGSAHEGLTWLRSQGLGDSSLPAAMDGLLETTLTPITCTLCAGEGCERCQRCGVSGRRGHLEIARLDATLNEADTIPPFERERRKLTA